MTAVARATFWFIEAVTPSTHPAGGARRRIAGGHCAPASACTPRRIARGKHGIPHLRNLATLQWKLRNINRMDDAKRHLAPAKLEAALSP